MIKKRFSVPVLQTRTGTVTAIMEINAIDERAADALRDTVYDTINSMRRLLGPLQHITASEVPNEQEPA